MNYTGKDNLNVMKLAKNYNNFIFKWIGEKNYSNILDFGAGNGEFCNRFKRSKIVAVELDKMLRKEIFCNSFASLNELEGEKFDLIYSLNVLEHIEDDLNIMKQLYQKLNKNGEIKILVPAKMELFSEMDKKVGHYRRYEKKELINLLQKSGFDVIEYKYFDFLGYFTTLLYKIIDNSGNVNPSSIIFYDKIIFPISLFFDKLTFGKIIGKNLMIVAKKNTNKGNH